MQTTLANMQFSTIKEKIKELSLQSPMIHVTIHNKRNKVMEAPSTIIGIYERFLCVESRVQSYVERFTIHYSDLLTGSISIKELAKD